MGSTERDRAFEDEVSAEIAQTFVKRDPFERRQRYPSEEAVRLAYETDARMVADHILTYAGPQCVYRGAWTETLADHYTLGLYVSLLGWERTSEVLAAVRECIPVVHAAVIKASHGFLFPEEKVAIVQGEIRELLHGTRLAPRSVEVELSKRFNGTTVRIALQELIDHGDVVLDETLLLKVA